MLHQSWHLLFTVSGSKTLCSICNLLPSFLLKQDFTTTLHSTATKEHGEGTIRLVEPHTTSWVWRTTMTTVWASTTRNHDRQWIVQWKRGCLLYRSLVERDQSEANSLDAAWNDATPTKWIDPLWKSGKLTDPFPPQKKQCDFLTSRREICWPAVILISLIRPRLHELVSCPIA